jgi:hypothetical protein
MVRHPRKGQNLLMAGADLLEHFHQKNEKKLEHNGLKKKVLFSYKITTQVMEIKSPQSLQGDVDFF